MVTKRSCGIYDRGKPRDIGPNRAWALEEASFMDRAGVLPSAHLFAVLIDFFDPKDHESSAPGLLADKVSAKAQRRRGRPKNATVRIAPNIRK